MAKDFPYQIVAFLDEVPEIGESAYNSQRGWFAQIALKRRFNVTGTPEDEIIQMTEAFSQAQRPLTVRVGGLSQPKRMPVRVLDVTETERLIGFHLSLITALGENLTSRYPERDGDNYLPHITVEYGGGFVIDPDRYANKDYTISKICLLKDDVGEDSLALRYFQLGMQPIL